ncbi:hypothetical protein F5887DRAFT_1079142 [Amanita rubescens]|nr:hypothetical protein F5887DRAFT_1079142 [Amanita rubescens]
MISTHSVRIDGRKDGVEVEGVHLRRHFSVGDHVSVVNSLAKDWVGGVCFITKLEGSLITVQSHNTKDELEVHGWQLKPHFLSFSHGPAPQHSPMPKFTRDRLACHVGRMARIVGHHFYKGTLWISNVSIECLFDDVTDLPLTAPQSFARPIPTPLLPLPAVGGETPMPEPNNEPEDSVWNPAAPDPPEMIQWDGRAYLAKWSTNEDLLNKRVIVRIQNTNSQEVPVVMYGTESVQNEEGMIKGLESGRVLIHLTRRGHTVLMDPKFLIPVMPTNEKQVVVVLSGEHKGKVFRTMKPSKESPSDFPLLPHELLRRKAVVTMNAENLSRCDYQGEEGS